MSVLLDEDAAFDVAFDVTVDAPGPLPLYAQRRGNEYTIKTASHLWPVTLDANKCSFGPRRMRLVGTVPANAIKYAPYGPEPGDRADTALGAVVRIVRWALVSVYHPGGSSQPAITGMRLKMREVTNG